MKSLTKLLLKSGAAAVPATIFSSYSANPSALMGFCTDAGGGRWNMNAAANITGASFAFRIKGSSASMFAFSGDTTPFRVLVDSYDFTTRVIPTLSGGKIPLFSGLSDTWHEVMIWTDNSSTGQGFPTGAANLIEAFGSNAQVLPMGLAYYLGDPAFPGVFAGPRIDTTFFPQPQKQVIGSSTQTGWGTAIGSVHMKAAFDTLWLFIDKEATHVMISVGGALATQYALSNIDDGTQGLALWRKVNIAAQATPVDLIISGGGRDAAGLTTGTVMQGVMVVGAGASIAAPTATKRHVVMVGASQVEGINAGAGGYRNDGHLAQNRLGIYLASNGSSGGTITALTAAMPTVGPKYPTKDIIVLSIGINSADDANFQTDYVALINACLTAGWTKVICRGIVTTTAQTSKNAKIAAAVAAVGLPSVVYADVSTWVATTDGAGGTISMPDGAHPDAAGFVKMADNWVRDHASLFA